MTEPGIDYMLSGIEQLELAATILVIILVIILYLLMFQLCIQNIIIKKIFSLSGEPSPSDLPLLPVSAHFYRLSGIQMRFLFCFVFLMIPMHFLEGLKPI